MIVKIAPLRSLNSFDSTMAKTLDYKEGIAKKTFLREI